MEYNERYSRNIKKEKYSLILDDLSTETAFTFF